MRVFPSVRPDTIQWRRADAGYALIRERNQTSKAAIAAVGSSITTLKVTNPRLNDGFSDGRWFPPSTWICGADPKVEASGSLCRATRLRLLCGYVWTHSVLSTVAEMHFKYGGESKESRANPALQRMMRLT